MAYAKNNIRDYWDAQGKPEVFTFDCLDFDSTDYVPYLAKHVIAYNAKKVGGLKSLSMQYPVYTYDAKEDKFSGTKGIALDIDVTYVCNLACANCNRASHLTKFSKNTNKDIKFFEDFITNYKHLGKDTIVKLVGGEPTLHPKLGEIMQMLAKHFTVWVLTNGIKKYRFPVYVYVENSAKIKGVLPEFHTTYMAPIDDARFDGVSDEQYSKGCEMLVCGYGYDETGIHPCTIGMALNRLIKLKTGFKTFDECDKHTTEYLKDMCKLCGLFKKMGCHNIDKSLFNRTTENQYSKSWEFLEK